jgi:hypothetical protein
VQRRWRTAERLWQELLNLLADYSTLGEACFASTQRHWSQRGAHALEAAKETSSFLGEVV